MITVTTKALQTALVTLAHLKEAIDPGDADDTYLERLIGRVTSHFERECRRKFGREVVTETFNGNGRTDLALERFPVVNLGALTLDSSTIATTEYKILNPDSGMIFMETGWTENIAIHRGIALNRLPYPGDKDYSLIYTGGFLLPGDEITTGIAVTSSASGKTFTRSSGKWPLLVDGDHISFAGFVDTTLDIEYTVASRTDLIITVDETPTADEAGTSVTLICQTLPEEIEQAAIELANAWFIGRSRDSAVKAEKIGDYSVTYGGAIPDYVNGVIGHYAVIF